MNPARISQRIYERQRKAADNRERDEHARFMRECHQQLLGGDTYYANLLRAARKESGLNEVTGEALGEHLRPDGVVVRVLDGVVTGLGTMTGPNGLGPDDLGKLANRDFEPVNVRQQAADRLREWGRKRMAEVRAGFGVLS